MPEWTIVPFVEIEGTTPPARSDPMPDQIDHLEGLRGAGAGRAYTQYYGWSLRCIWCGYTTYGRTKRDALVLMQMHYDEETSPARAAIR